MANIDTLSPPLGRGVDKTTGWMKKNDPGRVPSLAIVRDPGRRIRQAVRDNNVSLLDRLQHKYDLRNADRSRMTSLSWAAVDCNLEVFEWLLMDFGHDDQELSRDYENNSILHILATLPSPGASFARNPVLPPRPDTRPKEDIYAIVLKMAALYTYCFPFLHNWCNTAGKTPMHIAAQAGHTPMVQFLIDNDADKDVVDTQGNSPLHYASAYGHVDTLKLLLESGCAFNVRNAEGFTAAEFAYTERVFVELESTARAVSEGRRRQKREEKRTPTSERSDPAASAPVTATGVQRIRSGSNSTSGSGLASNAGSSSAHGSQGNGIGSGNGHGSAYGNGYGHGRTVPTYAMSTGSPNLMDRDQYFDAIDTTPRGAPSRGQTPPMPMSRRGSEGLSERSSPYVLAPPVPPLPTYSQYQQQQQPPQQPRLPHRSDSLPGPQPVKYPMVFPTQSESLHPHINTSAMRRSRSAQNGEESLASQSESPHQRFTTS